MDARDGAKPLMMMTLAGIRTLMQLVKTNLLLVFVPLGFLAYWQKWPDTMISLFNLVAIMPLSARLSAASDTIGNRWGSLIGGLVNATFGNTVELIVSLPYTVVMMLGCID